MSTMQYSKITSEILWWIVSAIGAVLILIPIFLRNINFPFLAYNILFILIFINYTRIGFLLKHTPFAWSLVAKLLFVFTTIPLSFLLVEGITLFQRFLDEQGIQSILTHLPMQDQGSIGKYIQSEMIFFGVGSLVAAVFLCLRCIVSIWRVKNDGKV